MSLAYVRQKTLRNLQLAGKLLKGYREHQRGGSVPNRTLQPLLPFAFLSLTGGWGVGGNKEKEGEKGKNNWLLKSTDFGLYNNYIVNC